MVNFSANGWVSSSQTGTAEGCVPQIIFSLALPENTAQFPLGVGARAYGTFEWHQDGQTGVFESRLILRATGNGRTLFSAWSNYGVDPAGFELVPGLGGTLESVCSINATTETCYADNDSLRIQGDGFQLTEFESTRIEASDGSYDVHLLGARKQLNFVASEICPPDHAHEGTLLSLLVVAAD